MSKIYSLEDAKNLFQTLLRKNTVEQLRSVNNGRNKKRQNQ